MLCHSPSAVAVKCVVVTLVLSVWRERDTQEESENLGARVHAVTHRIKLRTATETVSVRHAIAAVLYFQSCLP